MNIQLVPGMYLQGLIIWNSCRGSKAWIILWKLLHWSIIAIQFDHCWLDKGKFQHYQKSLYKVFIKRCIMLIYNILENNVSKKKKKQHRRRYNSTNNNQLIYRSKICTFRIKSIITLWSWKKFIMGLSQPQILKNYSGKIILIRLVLIKQYKFHHFLFNLESAKQNWSKPDRRKYDAVLFSCIKFCWSSFRSKKIQEI